MKLLVNKCNKTIILNPAGHPVELRPKGMPRDRKEVTDKFAEGADIAKFVAKGWLEVLSTTEAAYREAAEAKQKEAVAAPAVEAPSAPAPEAPKPVETPVTPIPTGSEEASLAPAPEVKEEDQSKVEEKPAEHREYTSRRRR